MNSPKLTFSDIYPRIKLLIFPLKLKGYYIKKMALMCMYAGTVINPLTIRAAKKGLTILEIFNLQIHVHFPDSI